MGINQNIKNVGKFGMKGVKSFIGIIILFGFLNTILLIVAIVTKNAIGSFINYNALFVLLLGVLFNILALYLTYKRLFAEGVRVVYGETRPFFKKLSSVIVEKLVTIGTDNLKINSKHITKALNVDTMLAQIYGDKVPKLVQKVVLILIRRIPFYNFLYNIKDSLEERNTDKASLALFGQVDNFIDNLYSPKLTMSFLYWLVPLNVMAQLFVIYFI